MCRIIFILFTCCSLITNAQLNGSLTDSDNNPIAFASIYIVGGNQGTTTNQNGEYYLKLPDHGTYNVTYQSLGYKTKTISISYSGDSITQDLVMQQELTSLDAVVISNAEDPAYQIIRQAIKHRVLNRQKTLSYTADFYSRGLWRMDDVPEKFMGREIGDLNGSLDSISRSGIVYLSETVSQIAFQAPDNFKEHIIASKVSGDDNGFSVNSAESANFDFYQNTIDLNNRIVSPIADFALRHYNYKLVGTFYDDHNFLINKIKVTSKRSNDNTFNGFIYIVEDQWNIYGLELTTTGQNINVPIIKELVFNQSYSYQNDHNNWIKRSQSIDFSFGFLGFKGTGRFIANYSNYNFKPLFDASFFGPEVLSFEQQANKKDSTYWINNRRVPLTLNEQKEYIKKDSIATIRNNPIYKDSIDRVKNKFKLIDVLMGYSYQNSNKRYRIGYKGLTDYNGFNTVQGHVLGSGIYYSKGYDQNYNKYLYTSINVNYGFADNRVRYNANIYYRLNRINRPVIRLSAGTIVNQINNSEPISAIENSIASLFFERNFAKFYELDYAKISYSQELINGLYTNAAISLERRQPLVNTTDQVFFNQSNREYTSNNPIDLDHNNQAIIDQHNIIKSRIGITYKPGQRYQSYPDQKYNITNTKYPTIGLDYQIGFASDNSNYNYHQLNLTLDQSIDQGIIGSTSYWVNAGTFINSNHISFIDYQHFNGNRLRYRLETLTNQNFGLLNYYDYSTNSDFTQAHVQHDFKGFALGKIPLINKLNYNLIIGSKALFTDRNPYFETNIGISNIGWGKIRPLRVDYVHSITSNRQYGAFIVSINFDL